ncbi:methyltransferase domain-containing protein [Rhabdothermincola salaria]|uniref:methyltransferase domain-containing protein n=1 Tax=Rhabdothermincola salaria TaxID=2903142 RepID=UPI001E3101D7|nr:methyltransferase domain-containing protein [Rhabdothermincola salaria]MCD9624530.1 methyltransferase domain-containing protein [Rhabdothermincola salaria]
MSSTRAAPVRPRNDLRQYDDLAETWWDGGGPFAALHWLAEARGRLVPAPEPGAVAVDLGTGGGLMAAHLDGYHHIGLDLTRSALHVARRRGVMAAQADVRAVPLATASADVVLAGELFEHVRPLEPVVAEIARVLRPGGTVVFDTLNDTRFARTALVTVAERLPGGPPPRIHDPALFVAPDRLRALFADHGVDVTMHGLRPSVPEYLRFLVRRRGRVTMVRTRSLNGVYAGTGRKR